jgi:uncharacterized protein HemX
MLFDETGDEGGEERASDTQPSPAGRGLLARLKGIFSRREKAVAEEGETAQPSAEEAPRRRFSAKKWLLVGLPVLLLVGLAGGGTLYAFKRMEAAKEAEVARQLAELKAKQVELEKQKAELEALKRQAEKQAEASRQAAAPAPPQGKPDATRTAQDDGPVDCTVTKGGEDAAQTLKRCIDSYNRATGR